MSGAPPRNPYNAVQADLFASWEIDLFGRLRRQTEAAQAELLATEEGRRATVLSLVAAIANGYVALRAIDRQLEISRATLRSRTDARPAVAALTSDVAVAPVMPPATAMASVKFASARSR